MACRVQIRCGGCSSGILSSANAMLQCFDRQILVGSQQQPAKLNVVLLEGKLYCGVCGPAPSCQTLVRGAGPQGLVKCQKPCSTPLCYLFCRPSIHSLPPRVCRRTPALLATSKSFSGRMPAPTRICPLKGSSANLSPGPTTCVLEHLYLTAPAKRSGRHTACCEGNRCQWIQGQTFTGVDNAELW